MNWLDILLLVILAVFTFMGVRMGIIKIFFTLVGGIVGVVLAGHYAESLGNKLSFISSDSAARIVAFIVIVIVVMLAAWLLAFIVRKIASAVLLGWVDRLGGGVLGLIMGAICCGAVLAGWLHFQGNTATITDSGVANFLVDKLGIAIKLLPGDWQSVRNYF